MHPRICDQNVTIQKIALVRLRSKKRNPFVSRFVLDRLVQRLIVKPCRLNWRFYAKMHPRRCLGLARNELGVELDQLLDIDVSTGPKQQNF